MCIHFLFSKKKNLSSYNKFWRSWFRVNTMQSFISCFQQCIVHLVNATYTVCSSFFYPYCLMRVLSAYAFLFCLFVFTIVMIWIWTWGKNKTKKVHTHTIASIKLMLWRGICIRDETHNGYSSQIRQNGKWVNKRANAWCEHFKTYDILHTIHSKAINK